MCKIDICINLEGWDGEGDERGFQKGRDEKKKKKGRDVCIPMADSC